MWGWLSAMWVFSIVMFSRCRSRWTKRTSRSTSCEEDTPKKDATKQLVDDYSELGKLRGIGRNGHSKGSH